jgi:hypothetical protein
MLTKDLRARIFAVIGATTVAPLAAAACGSEAGTSSSGGSTTDAGGDADARADAAPGFGSDASPDAAPSDASNDADEDARPPTVRRPFLVGASLRSAAKIARDDWAGSHDMHPTQIDDDTRAELARAWLEDGLQEHASIAAFARFTMLLLSVGAPPELVAASQRASIDEIAHARDCFALARRYGREAVGPGPLEVHDALGPASLVEIAALAAAEGCVGETVGVAVATEQLALAADPGVRRALERIVRDETRHAELAWRFAAWCVAEERRGRGDARGALRAIEGAVLRTAEETRAMEIRPRRVDPVAYRAHGRLACAEARAAAVAAIDDVVLPALAALRMRAPADVTAPHV